MNAVDVNMQVQFLETAQAFQAIETAWLELERETAPPTFFQSYAWCGHAAATLAAKLGSAYKPLVAVGIEDGTVVAIWPLSLQRHSGIRYLKTIDDPFGQFSGLLAKRPSAKHALVRATLAHVRRNRLADVMKLDRVFSDDELRVALAAEGATVRGEVSAPSLQLSGWQNFDALKASRNKKTMKNLRNAVNRLSKAGVHEHRIAYGSPDVSAIVDATLQRRSEWLEARGMTAPQFRSPAHRDVLTGGGDWGLDRQRIGFELLCGGRAIAHQWGFVHQNRYYAYMSATDPAAVHLSAGRLHLAFVIAASMTLGVDAVEMLTPASDYKMVWTDTTRSLTDMAMSITLRGRLNDVVWEQSLRPAIKKAFYALPPSFRRRAVTFDNASGGSDES
jgi:CelD/BcsL family acetyltransferase involved in cellulose biosynthesis